MGSKRAFAAMTAMTAIFVMHCGGSSTTDILDPGAADGAAKDGASSSSSDGSSTTTTGDGSATITDAAKDARPSGGDAGAPCTPSSGGSGGDSCSDGLTCLCCGSAGPKEICLCTTACTVKGQCSDPARPMCNQVDGQPGICTPTGFNCCWLCQ